MCNLSLVLANAGNCGAGMGDGVMFSMKPLLLLGTGDCGLASLLAGLYWRLAGGVRAGWRRFLVVDPGPMFPA